MIQRNHPLVAAIRVTSPVAAEQVAELLRAADAVVEQSRPGFDSYSEHVYCVPVEAMNALSAELARVGGVS